MEHPLGREKLSKLIIQYSIPSIISFVVNSLYNMVDQVFIGQGVGYLGIATSVQPIYGFNYGCGQYGRVKKTFRITMFTSVVVMLLALVIFQIFPQNITALFGQESDLYMEFAVKSFRIFLLACFLQPVASVTGIFFQSIGKPVLSAVCSMSRQIVFMIPSMILLGKLSGIEGILWAGPVADTFSAVIAGAMLMLFWKKIFKEKV